MTENPLPLSGYAIEKVYSTHLELQHQPPSQDAEQHEAFQFGWSWRRMDDNLFEVRISTTIEPSPNRDERIVANVIGRFRQFGESPLVDIQQFVKLQSVAILLPYARQFLSQLTANSYHGAYYLPTLNVDALMKRLKGEPARAQAKSAELPAVSSKDKPARRESTGGKSRKKR